MKRRYFTLIEVLVAAVILSTAIILATESLQQSMLLMNKSVSDQERFETSLFVKSLIDSALDEKKREGYGIWGDWKYEWESRELEEKTSRKDPLLPIPPAFVLNLLEVTMTLKKGEYEYKTTYKKLVWRER